MTSLEALLADLRRRDPHVRITAQRRLVLEALLAEASGHHTCEDVARAVAVRGIVLDQSTVYRILQWLKDIGIVAQTDLGTGSDVYSLVLGRPHHHLVCLECGAITDIDDSLFDTVREKLKRVHSFHPRIEHSAIYGTCGACWSRKHSGQSE
jgi:Fur family ferric uptake transcriptional regulator